MNKQRKLEHRFKLQLTEEQLEMLKERAEASGFITINEYIRFELFLKKPIMDKINKIYQKVCREQNDKL